MARPFVSLVVVVLDGEETLGECLHAIEGLDYPEEGYEVIVVDGGSKDRSREIAGIHRVILLSGGNIPASRNLGFRKSKGDIIGFVDADSVLPADWLAKAVDSMGDSDIGCIGGGLTLPDDAPALAKAMTLHTGRTDWLPTRACLYRREALEMVGGFDESLDTGEDWDVGVRISAIGYRIVRNPALSFVHKGYPKSAMEVFAKRMWWSKNLLRLWAKQGFSARLLPNVAYAAYHTVWLILMPLLALGSPYLGASLVLSGALLLPVPALVLAANSAIKSRRPSYIHVFALMYLIWGFGDACAILAQAMPRRHVRASKSSD